MISRTVCRHVQFNIVFGIFVAFFQFALSGVERSLALDARCGGLPIVDLYAARLWLSRESALVDLARKVTDGRLRVLR